MESSTVQRAQATDEMGKERLATERTQYLTTQALRAEARLDDRPHSHHMITI